LNRAGIDIIVNILTRAANVKVWRAGIGGSLKNRPATWHVRLAHAQVSGLWGKAYIHHESHWRKSYISYTSAALSRRCAIEIAPTSVGVFMLRGAACSDMLCFS